jgi:hypothetical protein
MREGEMHYLWSEASERKRRLFECACCRIVWQQLNDERTRHAVEVAELYADGLVDDAEREAASGFARAAWDAERAGVLPPHDDPYHLFIYRPYSAAAYNATLAMGWWGGAPAFDAPSKIIIEAAPDQVTMRAAVNSVFAELFGDPFDPVAFDRVWRTTTALSLASQMYESRDFSAMPILADALQDAGCEDEQILSHCRSNGQHVRGCWVVDLVLGKE